MKIINRYIIKEFFPKFFTSLLLFTFVLIMDQLFDLADLLINKKVGLYSTLKLFAYILPSLFMFTVPMSVLAGTILLFSRMTDDNEITALRTAGISPVKIIKPVAAAAFFFALVMVYFNSSIAPASNAMFKKSYYKIAYANPIMQLSEKSFVQVQNYNIYIKKVETNGMLRDVLIYRWTDELPIITTARTAEMTIVEGKGLLLKLYNGRMYYETIKNQSRTSIGTFLENEMALIMNTESDFLSTREASLRETKSSELLKKMKTAPEGLKDFYLTEFHMRLALGCAPFIFVFVAAPVSIFYKKKAKGFGITVTMAVIFVYYIMLIAGTTASERNILHPAISVWLPNVLVGAAGFYLVRKTSKK